IERKGGRLAGGAEHVEAVAAVVDQVARELGCARGVGRAVLADGRGDGGDHAAEFGFGHDCSFAQPLTLNAASAAMLTSCASLAPSCTICTGRSRPTSSGPITVAPTSSWSILVEIEAEWNAGIT